MYEVISIHAPRTGSDGKVWEKSRVIEISIHAPRTGSDTIYLKLSALRCCNFNPRSPHGERRSGLTLALTSAAHFNPRSPHGERRGIRCVQTVQSNFNPRSPHGERLKTVVSSSSKRLISIHAPRTGSDGKRGKRAESWNDFNPRSPHGERLDLLVAHAVNCRFQSTLPARGATSRSTGT